MLALYGESSAGRVEGSDRLLIQTVAPVSAFALLCGGQRHLLEPQDSRSAGVGFDWNDEQLLSLIGKPGPRGDLVLSGPKYLV